VVEHDEDTIYSADYLVDIGPGAGIHGGNVVAAGWLDDLLTAEKNESGSVTLSYLRGEKEVPIPEERRTSEKGSIKVRGATLHNLKNQNVDIPLGKLVAITGVSGSGKSTFLYDVLHKNVAARMSKRGDESRECCEYDWHRIHRSRYPHGPVCYRPHAALKPCNLYGCLHAHSRSFRGCKRSTCSRLEARTVLLQRAGGRCEACQGNGVIAVEMHFLPTVYVTCDVCNGTRFMKRRSK